jgi:hypothetical protein
LLHKSLALVSFPRSIMNFWLNRIRGC